MAQSIPAADHGINDLPITMQINKCIVATCNLNQWALDFDGNLNRIIESIREAKRLGAKYRMGPELEISGYSCEDHFLELDTMMHSDQSLAAILARDTTDGILCDIGCPILHNNVRYNCRVFCLNRKILLIRPKTYLADDGNYREKRFFTSWNYADRTLHDHPLSDVLRSVTRQSVVPFGVGVIATEETKLASEICEELWTPNSPHVQLYLSGVEIISNGSGSHHELRKLNSRLALMQNATRRCGGAYIFANHQGCDGNRVYFDGSSLIAVNGSIVAQATQFGMRDVEVITAVIDLEAIRSYRGGFASLQEQSSVQSQFAVVDARHFSLRMTRPQAGGGGASLPHSATGGDTNSMNIMHPVAPAATIAEGGAPETETTAAEAAALAGRGSQTMQLHTPEEECCLGPACWLWDYLRRSGAAGFLLPLSGGADSASVTAIVRVMCVLVAEQVLVGNAQVVSDVVRIFERNGVSSAVLSLAQRKLVTSPSVLLTSITPLYADTLTSDATTTPTTATTGVGAQVPPRLAVSMDSRGRSVSQDDVERLDTAEQRTILANELTYQLLHTVYMGTVNSSLNTLDRAKRLADAAHCYHSNMVIDDIVAAVLSVFTRLTGRTPHFTCKGGTMAEDLALQNIQARIRMVMAYLCAQLFPWLRGNQGFLLVLSSGNVDEALRGYMTKYDCSSGDLNPIGGICKGDLKRMLSWVAEKHNIPVLDEIAKAVPTAELRPIETSTSFGAMGDAASASASSSQDGKVAAVESTQADEEEMGMTYTELGIFGYLRKVLKCGPVRMFLKLLDMWTTLSPSEVAAKVKRFFYFYSVNRHKLTTLTPAYHAEAYSPDDNRYDMRPFLYNVQWTRQFATIDSIIKTHYPGPGNATYSAAQPATTAPAPPAPPAPPAAPAAPVVPPVASEAPVAPEARQALVSTALTSTVSDAMTTKTSTPAPTPVAVSAAATAAAAAAQSTPTSAAAAPATSDVPSTDEAPVVVLLGADGSRLDGNPAPSDVPAPAAPAGGMLSKMASSASGDNSTVFPQLGLTADTFDTIGTASMGGDPATAGHASPDAAYPSINPSLNNTTNNSINSSPVPVARKAVFSPLSSGTLPAGDPGAVITTAVAGAAAAAVNGESVEKDTPVSSGNNSVNGSGGAGGGKGSTGESPTTKSPLSAREAVPAPSSNEEEVSATTAAAAAVA